MTLGIAPLRVVLRRVLVERPSRASNVLVDLRLRDELECGHGAEWHYMSYVPARRRRCEACLRGDPI